jgi:hypothetical protein
MVQLDRMFGTRARAATVRPVDVVRCLVVRGLLAAIMVAGVVAAAETLRIYRECGGPFSRRFDASFNRYHCQLVIRTTKGGFQIKVPLP